MRTSLGIILFISISVFGQGTGVITTTSKNSEIASARISVLILKKNWKKIREYGDAAVEPLIKVLKDKDNDKEIRAGAAAALGALGDLRGLGPLIECLKDKDWHVRQQAAGALGKLGERTATDSLVGCLSDPAREVRLEVVVALENIADELAFKPLVKLLKDSEPAVRNETVKALLMTGGELSVEPFLEHLKDPDSNSKVEVIRALGVLRNKRAVECLIICLKDNNPAIRSWSVVALGKIGDCSTIEPLKKCLDDSERSVRDKAAEVLKKFQVIANPQEAFMPVDGNSSKVDKIAETTARLPPPQVSVPGNGRLAAEAHVSPAETIKKARKPEIKIQQAEVIEKKSSSWWLYGTIGGVAVLFVLIGLAVASSKKSEEISSKLDKMASQIREISRRKTDDWAKNAALSLLEAHAEALIPFPSDASTGEEKRKYLAILDDTIAQISGNLGVFHPGIRLLHKMRKLVKKDIDNGSLDSR